MGPKPSKLSSGAQSAPGACAKAASCGLTCRCQDDDFDRAAPPLVPAPLVLARPTGRPPGGGCAGAWYCACWCTPAKSSTLPLGGGGSASPGRWLSSSRLIARVSESLRAWTGAFSLPEPPPAQAQSATGLARLRAHATYVTCRRRAHAVYVHMPARLGHSHRR